MKIWLKYLIGIILGVVFALISSNQNGFFTASVTFLSDLAIQFGRYSLYPVLFFGFTISIYELRETRALLKISFLTAIIIIGTMFLLTIIGLTSVLILNSSRIPIFMEGFTEITALGIKDSFLQLFPSSAFDALINSAYILPLCIMGGFAGAGFAVDKGIAKPAINLFDSLSRVSYAVMVFFIDMLSLGMIALSAYWCIQFKSMLATKVFTDFAILLLIDLFFIMVCVYPLLIKLICHGENPYRVLYASLAPMFAAFFTGDTNVTLPVLLRHANESLGIRRKISSVTLPVFSIFGRAGSSMVITISFVVILKSYSSLDINRMDMLWLVGISMLFSAFLGRFPIGGTYIALASICTLYGRGFEAGYLILHPAAFFIGSIAATIDALTAIVGTFIISHITKMNHTRDLRFFI